MIAGDDGRVPFVVLCCRGLCCPPSSGVAHREGALIPPNVGPAGRAWFRPLVQSTGHRANMHRQRADLGHASRIDANSLVCQHPQEQVFWTFLAFTRSNGLMAQSRAHARQRTCGGCLPA